MSFMRRLMTQKIGSTFIPYEDIFLGYGIAVTVIAPTGCDTANVRAWGAGGAGGIKGGPNNTTPGGGGGGGAFTIKKGISVSGGSSSFTCNVGAGGIAPTALLAAVGGNGGSTSITGTITLTSGGGGGGGGNTSTAGTFGIKDSNGDAESSNGTSGLAGASGGTGGNVGGISFITPVVANTGLGGTFPDPIDGPPALVPPGGGGHAGVLSWVPNTPADRTLDPQAQNGARGLVKIRWTKSNGSNTTPYVIYNIPMTFTQDSTPTYPSCAIQQIYTSAIRSIWETGTAITTGLSFVRQFIPNSGTNTCDFDSANSQLTLRIRANDNTELPQNFFTSLILPNGFTFDSSIAIKDYINTGNTPTYDTVWTWDGVSDGLITPGANQNIRFKV